MAQSLLRTGPQSLLKLAYDLPNGPERTIGYCTGLTFSVTQGQKMIFGVDSPFPLEIAQAAGPADVRGTVTLFMPKGSNPVTAGLVPPLSGSVPDADIADMARMSTSKYQHWRIYDRVSSELSFACNYCKVSNWTVVIQAKQVVTVQLSFEGLFMEYGLS